MTNIVAPVVAPAVTAPLKMGEYLLTALTPITVGEDSEHIVTLKLAAGYQAAFAVWDKYGLDIVQWIEMRQHARLGLCEVFHLLQNGSNYTMEQIFEAFMSNPAHFEALRPAMEDAFKVVLGVAEQKLIEELSAAEKDDGKKKKETPSSSTK